jgi:hypothetical protein
MRDELLFRIREARCRIEGRPPSDQDQATAIRRQAIEDFKLLLARKLCTSTRMELLFPGTYIWLETGPAVRFDLDDRHFMLAEQFDDVILSEYVAGSPETKRELSRLSTYDDQFEDRLLAAIGVALEIF